MKDHNEFHTDRGYRALQQNQKHLTPAMEDYLEMIYRNALAEGYIRIGILSELLNVSPPSATKMVQKLQNLGLLNYQKYGIIFLTESGKEIGRYLLQRHGIIERFLKNIGIHENLLIDTELMEHSITDSTLERLHFLNDFLDQNADVTERFEKFLNNSHN